MKLELVGLIVCGLVGTPETEQVRRDHSVPSRGEHWNHLPVEVAPRGLPVETEKDVPRILWPLVQIMHPQSAVSWKVLDIVGRVIEPGKTVKPFLRGSQVYGHALLSFVLECTKD